LVWGNWEGKADSNQKKNLITGFIQFECRIAVGRREKTLLRTFVGVKNMQRNI